MRLYVESNYTLSSSSHFQITINYYKNGIAGKEYFNRELPALPCSISSENHLQKVKAASYVTSGSNLCFL